MVYTSTISTCLRPVKQFNDLDIVEISYTGKHRRIYALTNTGQVYSSNIGNAEPSIRHHEFDATIVQLRGNFVLDSKGRMYRISIRETKQINCSLFITYIQPDENYVTTLNGLRNIHSSHKLWYADRKYSIVNIVTGDGLKFLLDKKGVIFTGPDKVVLDLTNVSDIMLYYNGAKPYLYTIDVNDKIQLITLVATYQFSLNEQLQEEPNDNEISYSESDSDIESDDGETMFTGHTYSDDDM